MWAGDGTTWTQLDAIDAGEVWDDWVELEVTKGAKKASGAVHLIITKAEEGVSVDEHAMVREQAQSRVSGREIRVITLPLPSTAGSIRRED